MKQNTKIGILGGTFDPVHNGHIQIAQFISETMGLNQILFIPAGDPAHKKGTKVTEAGLRYEMLASAIKDINNFKISDIEIKRKGLTYTVDTLKEIRKTFSKDIQLIYIIGADIIPELDTWKDYKENFKLCKYAAISRPGYTPEFFKNSIKKMSSLGADITPIEFPGIDISSRDIREKIKNSESVAGLLPDGVSDIIKRESLYME